MTDLMAEAREAADQFDRSFPGESAEADLLRRLADRIEYLTSVASHDHDPGGCTCGCPVPGCEPCIDLPSSAEKSEK